MTNELNRLKDGVVVGIVSRGGNIELGTVNSFRVGGKFVEFYDFGLKILGTNSDMIKGVQYVLPGFFGNPRDIRDRSKK